MHMEDSNFDEDYKENLESSTFNNQKSFGRLKNEENYETDQNQKIDIKDMILDKSDRKNSIHRF